MVPGPVVAGARGAGARGAGVPGPLDPVASSGILTRTRVPTFTWLFS